MKILQLCPNKFLGISKIALIGISLLLCACQPSDFKYKISNDEIQKIEKQFAGNGNDKAVLEILKSLTIKINVYGGKQCRVDLIHSYELNPSQKELVEQQLKDTVSPTNESFDCVWIDDWNWQAKRGNQIMQDGTLYINGTKYEKDYRFAWSKIF